MISGIDNVLTYPCSSINRTVPYFHEFKKEEYEDREDMFDYIGKQMKLLSTMAIDFYRPYFEH